MKILMTLESYFPNDTRVENEIDALKSDGHEVHIICSGKDHQSKDEILKGIRIHRIFPSQLIRYSSVACLKFPLYFWYWKRKISAILKSGDFDVVHIHDLPLIKPVSELAEIFHFKTILDLHENWPELLNISPHTKTLAGRLLCSIRQWKNYERLYLKKADKVIVVIEEAGERVRGLGVSADDVYIVSNTINLDEANIKVQSASTPDGKTILVYEGGITFHRGLQNVVEALKIARKRLKKFEFWVIGNGSYLEKLKETVHEADIEEFVVFYGNVPQNRVYELLGKSDFAVIPHLRSPHTDSTIPHKLFHYMYAGLPVISSDCIPLERIIKETSCGITYIWNDPSSLSEIISDIIENKKSFRTKYSHSQHWVREKYNWNFDAENLTSLYKNLL